jgi:hypothetical protein
MLSNPTDSWDSDSFNLEDRRASNNVGGPEPSFDERRASAFDERERRGSAVSGSRGECARRSRWRPASKLSLDGRRSSEKEKTLFSMPESSESAVEGRRT